MQLHTTAVQPHTLVYHIPVFHILVDSLVHKAVEAVSDPAAEEAPGVEEAVQEQGVVAEQVAVVVHHRTHSLLLLVDTLELDRRQTINFIIYDALMSLATD